MNFIDEAQAAFRGGDTELVARLARQKLTRADSAGDIPAEVDALCMLARPTSQPGRDPYRLRLVLKGDQPPAGRFLTGTELEPYAKGPVV